MNDQEIADKIASFSQWHYELDLQGHKTPIFDPKHAVRHRERKRYFFDPLVSLLGGLAGKRVLDLGCNAGFWSLSALEAGAEFVVGIDGRQMHVDQAEFVFDVNGIDRQRYRFLRANLFEFDLSALGSFDVVLFLGLMYHIAKPMELMEKISAVNTDVCIIDTTLSSAPGAHFEIRHDPIDEPRSAVDYELVLYPTRAAVAELGRQFGYSTVLLKPEFSDYTGSPDYRTRLRRAFVLAKQTDLSALRAPTESLRPSLVDVPRWAAVNLRRSIRRHRASTR